MGEEVMAAHRRRSGEDGFGDVRRMETIGRRPVAAILNASFARSAQQSRCRSFSSFPRLDSRNWHGCCGKKSRSLPGLNLNLPCPVRGERLENLDRKLNDSGTNSDGCGRHAFTGSQKQPACPQCSNEVPKHSRNTTRAGAFFESRGTLQP